MDKLVSINWFDGKISNGCRFVYYGQGTRNEYRITRLSRKFREGDFVIIVKETEDSYLGYMLTDDSEVDKYYKLKEFKNPSPKS